MPENLTQRVCALTVPYPGVTEWFRHGHEEGLWDLHVLKEDQTDIDLPDADAYLLGAWHPVYGELIPGLKATGARVFVGWSSSPTEMDHASFRGNQVELLYASAFLQGGPEAPQVDGFACLCPDMVDHLPNAFHLPAPIHLEPMPGKARPRAGIAFYAPGTPKKNIFTQLLAVREVQRQKDVDPEAVRLRTNLEHYKPILEAFGIDHELQGWMRREDLLKHLSWSTVAMCASHAESFCYGAVDAMMMGTQVIGSRTIGWLPNHHVVFNPNSPREIAALLSTSVQSPEAPETAREWIESAAATNNETARRMVQAHLLAGRPVAPTT